MALTFYRANSAEIARHHNTVLGTLTNRVSAWNNARRTRNELSQLSAHELNDIGLSRGDLDNIGRHHV